jgi:hypothetical protein
MNSLDNFSQPFIELNEKKRQKPLPKNVAVYRIMKKMYHSLSRSVLSTRFPSPFELRIHLSGLK